MSVFVFANKWDVQLFVVTVGAKFYLLQALRSVIEPPQVNTAAGNPTANQLKNCARSKNQNFLIRNQYVFNTDVLELEARQFSIPRPRVEGGEGGGSTG